MTIHREICRWGRHGGVSEIEEKRLVELKRDSKKGRKRDTKERERERR